MPLGPFLHYPQTCRSRRLSSYGKYQRLSVLWSGSRLGTVTRAQAGRPGSRVVPDGCWFIIGTLITGSQFITLDKADKSGHGFVEDIEYPQRNPEPDGTNGSYPAQNS